MCGHLRSNTMIHSLWSKNVLSKNFWTFEGDIEKILRIPLLTMETLLQFRHTLVLILVKWYLYSSVQRESWKAFILINYANQLGSSLKYCKNSILAQSIYQVSWYTTVTIFQRRFESTWDNLFLSFSEGNNL